jgi:hypothetical protein
MARTAALAGPYLTGRPAPPRRAISFPWVVTADVLFLTALVCAGLAVRLWVLGVNDEMNADEVIPGLMARHILLGARPVFFYGQHYFGAAEAYLIAAVYAVAGFHPRLAVVPALAASLALIPVTYLLGRHLGGRAAGWAAAVPVAIAPPLLAKLYGNSGGGFSLAFLLHGVTLLLFLGAMLVPAGKTGLLARTMLFSLLAGVLIWIWQPALALYPLLLFLLLLRQPSLRHPLRLVLAVAPLLVGLAPPLLYNLDQGWPSATQLLLKYSAPLGTEAAPGIGQGPGAIWSLLLIGFGGGNEAEGGANPLQGTLVAVAIPLALLMLFQQRGQGPVARRRWTAAWLLGLVALLDALAAHNTVRHLAPVAHLGFAFAGAALVLLCRRLLPGARVAADGLALLFALVLVAAPNLYLDANAGRLFRRFVAGTSDVNTIVAALDQRGLTIGYADYWTAYPLTYFAAERIVAAPGVATIWGERVDRYPPYVDAAREVDDVGRLFLLLDNRCDPLPYLLPLEQEDATYRAERIAGWYLIWDIRPAPGNEAYTLWMWRRVITTRSHC